MLSILLKRSVYRELTANVCLAVVLFVSQVAFASHSASAECRTAFLDVPINRSSAIEHNVLTVDLTIEGVGRLPITVDTGSPRNVMLLDDDRFAPGTEFGVDPQVKLKEFPRAAPFKPQAIPVKFALMLKDHHVFPFIINPALIDEENYIVLDLQHMQLLAFHSENDLRQCFEAGLRIPILPDETAVRRYAVDGRIDTHLAGRVVIDTGAEFSTILAPSFFAQDAIRYEDHAYWTVNGVRIVPLISRNHVIEIGGKRKLLDVIDLPSHEALSYEKPFIAALGRDALKDSILVFPPKKEGYWELIF